ncbi:hypothetical protein F0Z19_4967 [Vibrio cyclitrophicus]|nr:hypothetical protein F0Z19_4967 [Vibrio cyclitrophicus]
MKQILALALILTSSPSTAADLSSFSKEQLSTIGGKVISCKHYYEDKGDTEMAGYMVMYEIPVMEKSSQMIKNSRDHSVMNSLFEKSLMETSRDKNISHTCKKLDQELKPLFFK